MPDDAIPQGGPQPIIGLPLDVPDPADVEAFGAWADEQLRLIGDGERTIETYHAIAERRKKDAEMWAKQESEKVERDLIYRRGLLEYAAKAFPFPRGLKSMSLPFGTFGTRVQALSVEVKDAGKAVAYSEMNGLQMNATLTVHDSASIAALHAYAEHLGLGEVRVTPRPEALLAFARERRTSNPKWGPDWIDDGWLLNGGEPAPFVKTNKVVP